MYKKIIGRNSVLISNNQEIQIKLLQESLFGIKEVILRNLYEYFIKKFNLSIDQIKISYAQNLFLSQHLLFQNYEELFFAASLFFNEFSLIFESTLIIWIKCKAYSGLTPKYLEIFPVERKICK